MKCTAPLFLITFILLSIFSQSKLVAQNEPLKFYEIIKDDSVRMFFTSGGHFTQRECADFTRYTCIDSVGSFNGYFKDIDHRNNVLCTGNYHHGKKNGYFELFYFDGGTIRSRGSYVDNVPKGPWEYFYENGLPQQTVMATEVDTLLIKFVDREGIVKVTDGNGEFAGFVTGNVNVSYNQFFCRGKIQNGKPDGTWKATFATTTFCEEIFDHGKLIKGKFYLPNLKVNEVYDCKSYLKNFFLNDHLRSLENFNTMPCSEGVLFPALYFIAFDPKYFSTHLGKRIGAIVKHDMEMGSTSLYPVGDNFLCIQFDINALGRAENFVMVTPWGAQFLRVVTANIKGRVKFSRGFKTLYFHLNMHVDEDHKVKYDFRFSKMK
jgi:antitoxin component YwqK of YwqJK toxin-antitoxin module